MGQFGGVEVVTRECGRGLGAGGCRTRVLGGGAQATICSCVGDLCNVKAGVASVFVCHLLLIYAFFCHLYVNI